MIKQILSYNSSTKLEQLISFSEPKKMLDQFSKRLNFLLLQQWQEVCNQYVASDTIKGQVINHVTAGMIVQLNMAGYTITGLVYKTNLPDNTAKLYPIGMSMEFIIDKISPDKNSVSRKPIVSFLNGKVIDLCLLYF